MVFGRFIAILLLFPSLSLALSDSTLFLDFRFNTTDPGARSLALGGAFTALADDATAAASNPAGLVFLDRPEYFIEGRLRTGDTTDGFFSGSNDSGSGSGVVTIDFDDVPSASFFSAVRPYGKWAFAISRSELLRQRTSQVTTADFAPTGEAAFNADISATLDADVNLVSASGAWRPTRKLGIGVTISLARLKLDSVERRVDTPAGQPPATRYIGVVDDTDEDLTFNLGILYKHSHRWSLGGTYRRGPRFRYGIRVGLQGQPDVDLRTTFNLPDVYGVGFQRRFFEDERLTLALGLDRYRYSELLDDFLDLLSQGATYDIDDATEARLGLEYVLPTSGGPAIAIRGGAFTEGDSTLRTKTVPEGSILTAETAADAETTRGDQTHGTLGVGVNFRRVKLDLAVDHASSDTEWVVSVIFQGDRR